MKIELDYTPAVPQGSNIGAWDSHFYVRFWPETAADFAKCEAIYEHHEGIIKYNSNNQVMYVITMPSKTHRVDEWVKGRNASEMKGGTL